jgi:Ser/Thr protein kinase RdoA (MazF antagonist)
MSAPTLDSARLPGAIPVDPDFPQLAIACDCAQMIDVFRRHLKPIAGKPCQIRECLPFRFRFRQGGNRCVLQYTLRLAEPHTGRECALSVTGLIYAGAGDAERIWRETQAADPRREIPESLLTFEPAAFIPELNMFVEIFPFDRKLRGIAPLLAGPVPELEPRLLASFGPGEWRAEQREVEPARYRTELGAVLRYKLHARHVETGVRQKRRFYVKVYRGDRAEPTFRLLQFLAARPAAEQEQFSAIRAIAYLRELNSLVVEEAPGTSFEQIILQDGATEMAARRAARAVVAFNQSHIPGAPRSSPEEQMNELKRAAKLLHWSSPPWRATVDDILRTVAAGLEDVPLAPIHRDLKPAHIFLEGNRVILIDLDSFALADPVRDPAHLLANIAAKADMSAATPEQAGRASRAFADEYFAHVPASWRKRLPVHYAGALLQEAAGLFKHAEPDWRERVGGLVEQAAQALQGNCCGLGPT